MASTLDAVRRSNRWFGHLYIQVLIAIVLGVLLGHFWPDAGESMKPLGDGFIKLIKMIVPPVIFLTVVTGISGMTEMVALGRVAGRAFAYFLFFSSLALVLGLVAANVIQPGRGLNIDPQTLEAGAVATYADQAHASTLSGFLMEIIPTTALSALTEGSILQTLFVAILFGVALAMVGEPARPVTHLLDSLSRVVFRVVSMIMRVAPIGAFGAIAFTIGAYGLGALAKLGALVGTFYFTSAVFIIVVLGAVARMAGFSIFDLIRYLKDELILVLGTSSSEAALPNLIEKMEKAGVSKSVVGLVVPTGYSFNLDGTNIYMTLAALFIAQACNIDLSLSDQVALLLIAAISSKGAAGVTGAGFITLAATLSIVPSVPVAGMALILGVDRFMSECRSLTNFIGNAVATIVVGRWENAVDRDQLGRTLKARPMRTSQVPEAAAVVEAPAE
ncbi:dicarboxylate/amino acid:cation symporter [Brevundimonas bullata]|uniref:dicarboxylate/amino acid:cation symporter n=1 Tax=Brevundimonas bullata TaxID=13160 RepID=UPI002FD90950